MLSLERVVNLTWSRLQTSHTKDHNTQKSENSANHRNPLVETTKQSSQQVGHSRVLIHLCEWKCHSEFVCQQFSASLGDEFASFFFFTSSFRISSHLFDDLCSNWKLKPETQTTLEHVLPIHHVNLVKRDFLLINIPPYMIECVRAHYGPARALAVCSEKLSWCESFFSSPIKNFFVVVSIFTRSLSVASRCFSGSQRSQHGKTLQRSALRRKLRRCWNFCDNSFSG